MQFARLSSLYTGRRTKNAENKGDVLSKVDATLRDQAIGIRLASLHLTR